MKIPDAFPPNGWLYREPSLNWSVPKELALQGIHPVAAALQTVRVQNPASGLDPSYEACLEAILQYTCNRFAGKPYAQAKYGCNGAFQEVAKRDSSRPLPRGCAGCGGRR